MIIAECTYLSIGLYKLYVSGISIAIVAVMLVPPVGKR